MSSSDALSLPPGTLLQVTKSFSVGDVDGARREDGLLAIDSNARRRRLDVGSLLVLIKLERASSVDDARYFVIAYDGHGVASSEAAVPLRDLPFRAVCLP